jgi:hypothetical protein
MPQSCQKTELCWFLRLQAGLALEWVYGYNASNTAPNAFYTSQQKIVYYVAALGVVYDPATHTQQFFQVTGSCRQTGCCSNTT